MKLVSPRLKSVSQLPRPQSTQKDCIMLRPHRNNTHSKSKYTSGQSSNRETLLKLSTLLKPKPIKTTRNSSLVKADEVVQRYPEIDMSGLELGEKGEPGSPINSITKIVQEMRADGEAKNKSQKIHHFGAGQTRKLKLFHTNKSPLKISLG